MSSAAAAAAAAATSETRMLERRVSNNRSDLDGDQKINYFISWFSQWSDLQKSDFVTVLAEKMSSSVNGLHGDACDSLGSLHVGSNRRPPSLFECQVKLFREWFSGWSDDQKNYLVLRLKDIDAGFFGRFEERVSSGGRSPVDKDYFEPGVPEALRKRSTLLDPQPGGRDASVHAQLVEVSDDDDDEEDEENKEEEDDDPRETIKPVEPLPRKSSLKFDGGAGLDTINEDACCQDNEESL